MHPFISKHAPTHEHACSHTCNHTYTLRANPGRGKGGLYLTLKFSLDGYLRGQGIDAVTLVGLATDFCVAYSAMDAARLGYSVRVIEQACRAIDLNGSLARAHRCANLRAFVLRWRSQATPFRKVDRFCPGGGHACRRAGEDVTSTGCIARGCTSDTPL